ncbi:ABC transporter substrate-binding protein [Aeromicrobium endophyticum]|uniref:ABC transporter substrate-binding protein n=2 Tax=Aeromicrobium endophyticum TaxID=2292704 RepID=A0A371PBP3_9ACTN|nr:ABC transporter substrate-binding protein [Aeromicrobium endophyticum]
MISRKETGMTIFTRSKRGAAFVTGLVLLGTTAACGGGSGSGGGSGPIKVGVPLGITGPAAGTADWDRMGVELSVKQINADGGIDGRKVKAVFVDTELDPAKAVTATNRLINEEKVDLVVGPMTSDETLATLPALSRANIPSINGAGSKLDPKVAPYSFGMLLNAEYQGQKMVDYAVSEYGAKKVAVISYSGTQGKVGREAIEKQLKVKGVEESAGQEYDIPVTDLSSQVLALKKGNPDVVLAFPQTGNDTGLLVQAMRDANLDVPVVGSYATTYAGQAKAVAGPDAYKNFVSVSWPAFSACSTSDVRTEATDFIAEVKKTYGEKRTTGAAFDNIASFRDALWLLKAGIEGSKSTDAKKVTSWLAKNETAAAKKQPLVHNAYALSDDSRFLMDPDSLTLVNAGTEVVPGIIQRIDGC